jgi:hypothetical protein
VQLSERHRAGLEPTIKDLRDSSQNSSSGLRRNGDMVNVFSVEISYLSAT